MKISTVTRRDIADAILMEGIDWSGRLEESEFLSRIFDLEALPSTDRRFSNAAGDIWQHRVNNPSDWNDDWIFHDRRFGLMNCDESVFLEFLCQTIHPVVRSESSEVAKLCQLYNNFLKADGFQLVEKTRISDKPVFVGRYVGKVGAPGLTAAKETLQTVDATYIAQQITRMEAAIINDPALAIGTAKELIESCCKTILQDRGIEVPKKTDLPKLVKMTAKELQLSPQDIPESARAAETIKKLLNNLTTIAQGIAELRGQYGTGHGKHSKFKGLSERHAKLAVGAASTLAVFLMETHQERGSTPPAAPDGPPR